VEYTQKPNDLLQNRGGESGGRRTDVDPSERVTQRARRIWEAFCRHKSETSGIRLPVWEDMDPEERKTMMSLAAESSSCDAIP
jgi:hypothetical protein